MSISQNFQDILPSLNLNFANAQALDPRVSFSRASTGTYVGPDGLIKTAGVNVPRFTYDPVTGKSLGFLIEEQKTNILTRSNEFTDSYWTTNALNATTSTTTATISPDGLLNAYKIIEDTTDGNHFIQARETVQAGYWTFSVYIKAAERTQVALQLGNYFAFGQTYFDLSNGSITTFNDCSSTIVPLSNGWYRCSVTGLNPYGTGQAYISINIVNNNSSSYIGDGNSGIYVYGAQMETGTSVTSYIPTAGSAITRSADIANIPSSYFSNFYNTSGGQLIVSARPATYRNLSNSTLVSLNDGTINNSLELSISPNSSGIQFNSTSSGTTQSSLSLPAYTNKFIASSRFTNNNFITNLNTTGSASTSSGTIPTPIQANIGIGAGSINQFSGVLENIAYFPTQLNDTSTNSLFANTPYAAISITPANNQFIFMIRINNPNIPYTLPTNNSGAYSYNVDWGDGTSTNNITTNDPTKTYSSAGVYRITITQNRGNFFLYQSTQTNNASRLINVVGAGSSFNWNAIFAYAYYQCSNITSFPQINTSSGTNFTNAWYNCSSLTSFPQINTSSGTNFVNAWYTCSSLTSFPVLNVSNGTDFTQSWLNCSSLTSFPAISFGGAGNTNPVFVRTWYYCFDLTTFPSNAFNACTGSTNYTQAFTRCALNTQSIENILTSIDTAGASNGTLDLSLGANASKSTWTTAANTSYDNLVTKGWNISYNP